MQRLILELVTTDDVDLDADDLDRMRRILDHPAVAVELRSFDARNGDPIPGARLPLRYLSVELREFIQ